jgi:4-hydroxymandelate oxidase
MSEFMSRRHALAGFVSLGAAQKVSFSQSEEAPELVGEPPGRIPPPNELVNAGEFEAVAKRKLDSLTFAEISGSEHAPFDRITLRPRLMVDTTHMDLTATLFGQQMFMPILAGPVCRLKRFHPEGELAMARGVSAAKSVMIVSADSSVPLDQIASQAKCPLWYQVWADAEIKKVRAGVEQAVAVGCKALCVTTGYTHGGSPNTVTAGVDWRAIDALRKGLTIPIIVKGIMGPEEAQKAIAAGINGIVVSNYSSRTIPGVASPIELLPAIAEAVRGKGAILIDGSFRLGSDVFKALALGAQAVLLGRPTVWGLAAYGEQGVQGVIELIQSEFARDMAMCGKVDLKALDRSAVKIHRR